MQSAFEKIEQLVGNDTRDISKAEAAKKLLEEMRTSKSIDSASTYRMEQALAKLVEYFQMEAELNMRRGELVSISPEVGVKLAANDDTYSVSLEDKYNVA